MKGHAPFSLLIVLLALGLSWMDAAAGSQPWRRLLEGLYFGEFDPPKRSRICTRKIAILKIDTRFHALRLLSASEHGRRARTARQWSREFGLLAAINASMYQNAAPLRSTGYMRNYGHENNPHVNGAFGAFLCFNPVDDALPAVRMVDRRLQKDWWRLISGYETVIQNYRMISDGKKRGWPQRPQLYGSAAVGVDRGNHVLFILSPSPFSTHDLIHMLLSLPLDLESAMYVEGGPEATLHLRMEGGEKTLVASCEGGSIRGEGPESLRKIPNVIGVVEKFP